MHIQAFAETHKFNSPATAEPLGERQGLLHEGDINPEAAERLPKDASSAEENKPHEIGGMPPPADALHSQQDLSVSASDAASIAAAATTAPAPSNPAAETAPEQGPPDPVTADPSAQVATPMDKADTVEPVPKPADDESVDDWLLKPLGEF